MSLQCFGQTLLSKFFSCRIEGLGDAIGVEGDDISREELTLADRAIPFLEQSKNRAGGVQPFQSIIAAKQKSRGMSTVGVAQALRLVVILGKEERRVGILGRVFIKQIVYGLQQSLWLIQRDGTLTAQIRLQIRHQESTGNSFSRNIA